MKYGLLGLIVFGLGLGLSSPADASFIGSTIRGTAAFPTTTGPTTSGPVDEVVGAGIEFTDGEFTPFFGPSFDFANSTITITHAQTGHQSGTFNGYQFFDLFDTIAAIVGVTVSSDSTGFFSGDPSRVFFDAENIFVNFESLQFGGQNNPTIVLDVTFGTVAQVPEPAALGLFGLGLAGLGLAGLRRARRRKMH